MIALSLGLDIIIVHVCLQKNSDFFAHFQKSISKQEGFSSNLMASGQYSCDKSSQSNCQWRLVCSVGVLWLPKVGKMAADTRCL